MSDNHEAMTVGHAQQYAPFLRLGMFWVRNRERERVPEGGSGFFERVLPEVRGGLPVIPLEREPHDRILSVILPDLHESGLTTRRLTRGGRSRQFANQLPVARPPSGAAGC